MAIRIGEHTSGYYVEPNARGKRRGIQEGFIWFNGQTRRAVLAFAERWLLEHDYRETKEFDDIEDVLDNLDWAMTNHELLTCWWTALAVHLAEDDYPFERMVRRTYRGNSDSSKILEEERKEFYKTLRKMRVPVKELDLDEDLSETEKRKNRRGQGKKKDD